MGWSIGWDGNHHRDIGYGVPAKCDFPKCKKNIDRGISFVCGSEPYGGDHGCGLYFCELHRQGYRFGVELCSRCENYRPHFPLKPDVKKWLDFKATDPSWAEWRKEQEKIASREEI